MASKIGELVVNLKANTASFISELDRSRVKATTVGVALGGIAAGIAEEFARMAKDAAAAFPELIKSSIDLGDQLNKASQKAGVTVEELSALRYAAKLSDVEFGDLTTSLGKLSKSIFEASDGSGKQADAFRQLGISVKDSSGGLKSAGDVMKELANRFALMQDGSQKTALAIEIFGRAGANLIPLLNQGSSGIAELTREAERLGLVVGGETARQSEEFNDNINKLKESVTGLGLSIANKLLPSIVSATEGMVEWAKDVRALPEAYADSFDKVKHVLNSWGLLIDKTRLPVKGLLKGTGALPEGFEEAPSIGPVQGPKFMPPQIDTEAFKKFHKEIERLTDLPWRHVQPFEMPIPQHLPYDNLSERLRQRTADLQAASDILVKDMDAYEAEQSAGPTRNFDELLKLPEKLENVQVKASELTETAKEMSNVFAQGFQDAILHANSFVDVLKNIGKELLAIAFNLSVTKPLASALTGVFANVLGGLAGGLHLPPGFTPAPSIGPVQGPAMPFVGSYDTGGTVPATGWAVVHAGEKITPAGMSTAGPVINLTVVGDPDEKTIRKMLRLQKATFGASVQASQIAARESKLRSA